MVNVLAKYEGDAAKVSQTADDDPPKANAVSQQPRQFLSLRSQVNGTSQLLFSGLSSPPQSKDHTDDTVIPKSDESMLPKGFELNDYAALGASASTHKREKRHFGAVFHPPSRIKPLDQPQRSRDFVRGNTLEFIPPSSRTENLPQNKNDYKFAKLATGAWLSYGAASSYYDRRRTHHPPSSSDFKATLANNDMQKRDQRRPDALFNSVYSSFAPSADSTYSIVSERDRSTQWWHKYGEQKLLKLFNVQESKEFTVDSKDRRGEVEEFADVVANFEPVEAEEKPELRGEDKEADDLLEEVSDLIETLTSYQRNRSLEPIATGSVPQPSKSEIDVFEMLKNQLSILISSLPPFAVAKLNGDQLEDLNISTKLLIEAPDFPGTGQLDEYELRKKKMAQQATSAASRNAVGQQLRPSYQQPQAAYNAQVRNYNTSMSTTPGYGVRQNYQTPTVTRPAYPQQTPYQTASNAFSSRPTIQQFQRPLQNGYGNYGGSPVQPQTPGFVQRPSQPGYQQRAQESALVQGRSASPQKPMVNGQHYPPRQYQAQQSQSPFPYQRQGSGTPVTPIAATTAGAGPGRYDGTTNQARTEGAAAPSTPVQTPAQQAQMQAAQTVEVSR